MRAQLQAAHVQVQGVQAKLQAAYAQVQVVHEQFQAAHAQIPRPIASGPPSRSPASRGVSLHQCVR